MLRSPISIAVVREMAAASEPLTCEQIAASLHSQRIIPTQRAIRVRRTRAVKGDGQPQKPLTIYEETVFGYRYVVSVTLASFCARGMVERERQATWRGTRYWLTDKGRQSLPAEETP